MSVVLLALVDEFAVDRVFLFPAYGDSDSLVTLVARYNPNTFFS